MKLAKWGAVFVAATSLSSAGFCGLQADEKKPFDVRLQIATDARDAENSVFEEAVASGKYDSLLALGQMGEKGCKKLVPYLRSSNTNLKAAAAKASAYCQDPEMSEALLEAFAGMKGEARRPWLKALGFSGGAAGKAKLVAMLAEPYMNSDMRAEVAYALMQNIVYDRAKASELEGFDPAPLIEMIRTGEHAGVAAYMMARFADLPTIWPAEEFYALLDEKLAAAADLSIDEREPVRVMVRLAREYGDSSTKVLLRIAKDMPASLALEAVRSMGRLSDADTRAYLMALADGDGTSATRHLAVASMGTRAASDPSLVPVVAQYVGDDNRWVAATALGALGRLDGSTANEVAGEWLAGEDYYLAFMGLSALTVSDDGKAILQEYTDANKDTVRGYEAAVALDPAIEGNVAPRKSPKYSLVEAYAKRDLVLETTRGEVCITSTGDAPYAYTNFLALADYGKMDGMLWHRVIPGFVAQAGQVENPELNKWGSIREEWGGEHEIGTVGVATAGRDTGTVQFFINTGFNRHLTGRYTVFGRVTKGMEHVFMLEEGDVIAKASTVQKNSARCQ
jgi:cyclophilin family peptidyl-prolyl cis-trans isomerase